MLYIVALTQEAYFIFGITLYASSWNTETFRKTVQAGRAATDVEHIS